MEEKTAPGKAAQAAVEVGDLSWFCCERILKPAKVCRWFGVSQESCPELATGVSQTINILLSIRAEDSSSWVLPWACVWTRRRARAPLAPQVASAACEHWAEHTSVPGSFCQGVPTVD